MAKKGYIKGNLIQVALFGVPLASFVNPLYNNHLENKALLCKTTSGHILLYENR